MEKLLKEIKLFLTFEGIVTSFLGISLIVLIVAIIAGVSELNQCESIALSKGYPEFKLSKNMCYGVNKMEAVKLQQIK